MSDLYRIHVGEEWLYEGGPEDVLQSLEDDGVLIPVSVDDLDIEAAMKALEPFMPTVYTANGLTRDAAVAVLRAAWEEPMSEPRTLYVKDDGDPFSDAEAGYLGLSPVTVDDLIAACDVVGTFTVEREAGAWFPSIQGVVPKGSYAIVRTDALGGTTDE